MEIKGKVFIVTGGASGLAEFVTQIESGKLRVLAVSGEKRQPQKAFANVPTLREEGIDMVFINWRGVLAPPGISKERQQQYVAYFNQQRPHQGLGQATPEPPPDAFCCVFSQVLSLA